MFKLRGEIVHVSSNWQSSLEVTRSKGKVAGGKQLASTLMIAVIHYCLQGGSSTVRTRVDHLRL